jgi:hypothetical protein
MLVLPSSTSLASRRMRTSLNSVRSTSFAPNCAPLQIRTASLLYRIVQTAVCLVVQPEAYDDAHIIPVGIQHRPAALRLHGGVSIALGEGDAISAETRNANPATSTHGIVTVRRPQAGIVERFELTSPDELVCRYTVTDSSHVSTSWTAQYLSVRSSDQLFELACNEENHAMRGMLAGARQEQLLAV